MKLKFLHAINPLGVIVTVVLVLLWEAAVQFQWITIAYLPAPSEVAVALVEQIASGAMLVAVGHTLWIALVSSMIAIFVGVVVGTLLGSISIVKKFSLASIDFLRSIPAVALIPVALLLLGPSPESEIVVATFSALWPILINTLGGVSGINPRLSEVARTLQLDRRSELLKIVVPYAVPSILVGARLSIINALVVAIIAEMMINPAGIGWSLMVAQQALRSDVLFAYAVITGVLGLLLNIVLVKGTQALMPGSPALREAE